MLHLATGGMCRYEKFSLPQSLLSAEVAGLNLEEVIGKPDTQEKCRRHDQVSCTVTHTHRETHTHRNTHTDTHRNTHMVKHAHNYFLRRCVASNIAQHTSL